MASASWRSMARSKALRLAARSRPIIRTWPWLRVEIRRSVADMRGDYTGRRWRVSMRMLTQRTDDSGAGGAWRQPQPPVDGVALALSLALALVEELAVATCPVVAGSP